MTGKRGHFSIIGRPLATQTWHRIWVGQTTCTKLSEVQPKSCVNMEPNSTTCIKTLSCHILLQCGWCLACTHVPFCQRDVLRDRELRGVTHWALTVTFGGERWLKPRSPLSITKGRQGLCSPSGPGREVGYHLHHYSRKNTLLRKTDMNFYSVNTQPEGKK